MFPLWNLIWNKAECDAIFSIKLLSIVIAYAKFCPVQKATFHHPLLFFIVRRSWRRMRWIYVNGDLNETVYLNNKQKKRKLIIYWMNENHWFEIGFIFSSKAASPASRQLKRWIYDILGTNFTIHRLLWTNIKTEKELSRMSLNNWKLSYSATFHVRVDETSGIRSGMGQKNCRKQKPTLFAIFNFYLLRLINIFYNICFNQPVGRAVDWWMNVGCVFAWKLTFSAFSYNVFLSVNEEVVPWNRGKRTWNVNRILKHIPLFLKPNEKIGIFK